jgi:hypothetical protein
MRLKAQLKVLLLSALAAEVTALFFSIVTQAATGEVSPAEFGLFGAVTLALAHRWVLVDVNNAFEAAVSKHYVLLAGAPPHITHIDSTCPRRWFVLLHIQLHPELIDSDFA